MRILFALLWWGKNWLLYPDGLDENLIFVHELRNVELRSDEGKMLRVNNGGCLLASFAGKNCNRCNECNTNLKYNCCKRCVV